MYNQDGKLEEWWTNSTSEGFNVRQKCIVDQYSSMLFLPCSSHCAPLTRRLVDYTVDDGKGGKIHVNGNLCVMLLCILRQFFDMMDHSTSGENIGDSGLIQAFRAWKAQYNDDTEFILPGLNYTR